MNARLDTIKRMADTDPYWRAYLDGMNDAHAVGREDDRTAEHAEHARLLEARLSRIYVSGNPNYPDPSTDPFLGRRASFMADKLSMDEARVKVAEDWDGDWTPAPAA